MALYILRSFSWLTYNYLSSTLITNSLFYWPIIDSQIKNNSLNIYVPKVVYSNDWMVIGFNYSSVLGYAKKLQISINCIINCVNVKIHSLSTIYIEKSWYLNRKF